LDFEPEADEQFLVPPMCIGIHPETSFLAVTSRFRFIKENIKTRASKSEISLQILLVKPPAGILTTTGSYQSPATRTPILPVSPGTPRACPEPPGGERR
jgi:hypothetical protein